MVKLIACQSILYQNRIYEAGEALPGQDAALMEAWLLSGAAKLVGHSEEAAGEPKEAPAAKPKARRKK